MTRSYNLWIHGLILSPMLFNSSACCMYKKSEKKSELKRWEKKKAKSKLNKKDFNFGWVFRYVDIYLCLCMTHKLNRLMKDGTVFFFSTMCFSYNQKLRFVMYMHLQYTL